PGGGSHLRLADASRQCCKRLQPDAQGLRRWSESRPGAEACASVRQFPVGWGHLRSAVCAGGRLSPEPLDNQAPARQGENPHWFCTRRQSEALFSRRSKYWYENRDRV